MRQSWRGYSKLAGSDEERTLARLPALRSDLIDPTIAVHHGRVVKRTGDGALVEFRSVVARHTQRERVLARRMMQKLLPSMALTALMLSVQVAAAVEVRPFYAEVHTFASDACPPNWAPQDGRILQIDQNKALFSLIGTAFGGDGKRTFALPEANPITSPEGTTLLWCIALTGAYFSPRVGEARPGEWNALVGEVDTFAFNFCPDGWKPLNSEPTADPAPIQCVVTASASRPTVILGEIITFGFAGCPEDWAPLDGRILQIYHNEALFTLLGTTYGGNGTSDFALPNVEPIATENGLGLLQCIALSGG